MARGEGGGTQRKMRGGGTGDEARSEEATVQRDGGGESSLSVRDGHFGEVGLPEPRGELGGGLERVTLHAGDAAYERRAPR
jgi:hypothetical protein